MFRSGAVALRPLEIADIPTLYPWEIDFTLSLYSGWISQPSRDHFEQRWRQKILEPSKDLVLLGIETEGQLVGYIQLGLIDHLHRRAAIGIVIGEAQFRGRGVGSTAVKILCDYAFTAVNLERLYAETYGFNLRAQRMFLKAGFKAEGIQRQHEIHNGVPQDLHLFGMLRSEFYERWQTIFQLSD